MNAYHDTRFESEPSGFHPYDGALYSSDVQYYDFKATPELIPRVLEDFAPWAAYDAITTFYELVRWLNSTESLLESNDSAFGGGPRLETDKRWQKALVVSGRIMIFYRHLGLNTVRENVVILNDAILHYLRQIDPELTKQQASVGTSLLPTTFSTVRRSGFRLQISFWSWGDVEIEAFENLDRLFNSLYDCLKRVSSDIRRDIFEGRT